MNSATTVTLVGQAIVLIAELSGPILIGTLVVGLVISLFQAVTSIQEFTLTFLPKLIVVAAILALSGHWMITEITDYTTQLFSLIPKLISVS
ncbi:MAG: flagellar biosynthesis protein FliQ [Firmicutes bacterium]|jgi:flagellar biosynthetic protein FliQ|nr:flagellar biosynthesis protein FliQ [Bacillota bacterium]